MKQRTIANVFTLEGIGLHGGKSSRLTFRPAPGNAGIVFSCAGRVIPALPHKVVDTRRGTSLEGVAVVEHLLSAIRGLCIDNIEIEIEGEEVPGLDGCAVRFVEALEKAGTKQQRPEKRFISVLEPIRVSDREATLEVRPGRGLKIDFVVDFPGIGEQHYTFNAAKQSYKKEIAPARTFGYVEEYEALKQECLARGAALDNVLVLSKDGYVNTPRFPDEMVRHKVLDLIGDLALAGRALRAEVRAVRSGHKLNVEMARLLYERAQQQGGK
jgi:UDP-3-O-[3-hydroxymyristoyl] N-acetylglucosamine deacetylase